MIILKEIAFTGSFEGNINSQRLISMMNVANNRLVVEEKGIYSIEKFLTARRLMYWQVYLHKTGLVSEKIIIKNFETCKNIYLLKMIISQVVVLHLIFFKTTY